MNAQARHPSFRNRHYLERELEDLIRNDRIWQVIRAGSLDWIWYRDLRSPRNEWMSPELWERLGFDPVTKSDDARAWRDLVHPDDLERAEENLKAHCADPSHPFDQVLRCRHADGSTVWVRSRGLAIRDTAGTPVRMLGTRNDVTPLKLAEEQAIRERSVMTDANAELQAFAYSTSHDLKSPANTIRMLLQEARHALRNGDPSDAESMLSKAEATNEAMRLTVDKLLEYTRVIGTVDARGPLDLDRLLSDVIDDLGADIARTGARITVARLGTVTGTDWQLRRMFQNLIANAIKFQPPGNIPLVEVRTRPGPPRCRTIEVADNGIGIAPADRTRVFDLFGRLHPSSEFPGSGVGLAFCARVARAHGTEIRIRSRKRGTVFSVDLPTGEDRQE